MSHPGNKVKEREPRVPVYKRGQFARQAIDEWVNSWVEQFDGHYIHEGPNREDLIAFQEKLQAILDGKEPKKKRV